MQIAPRGRLRLRMATGWSGLFSDRPCTVGIS